jgi:hypothetical protein
MNGNGPYDVGPYWQQPGRGILQNHLREIVHAGPSLLTDGKYLVFSGDWYPESKHPGAEVRDVIMSHSATLEGLEAYLRTWSAVHTYLEKFPDVAAMRGKGADGDVVDRIINKLKEEGVPEDRAFTTGHGDSIAALPETFCIVDPHMCELVLACLPVTSYL